MTPEEQRIAIAEWCGIKLVGYYPHPIAEDAKPVPLFCHDLNAMHEAVEKLNEKQRFRFVEILEQIQKPLNAAPWHWTWNLAQTTPAQRAEALLRTIGKWKE